MSFLLALLGVIPWTLAEIDHASTRRYRIMSRENSFEAPNHGAKGYHPRLPLPAEEEGLAAAVMDDGEEPSGGGLPQGPAAGPLVHPAVQRGAAESTGAVPLPPDRRPLSPPVGEFGASGASVAASAAARDVPGNLGPNEAGAQGLAMVEANESSRIGHLQWRDCTALPKRASSPSTCGHFCVMCEHSRAGWVQVTYSEGLCVAFGQSYTSGRGKPFGKNEPMLDSRPLLVDAAKAICQKQGRQKKHGRKLMKRRTKGKAPKCEFAFATEYYCKEARAQAA